MGCPIRIPTAPEAPDLGFLRRARGLRRLGIALLLTFLLLGVVGAFGVRVATASATGGGYELTVTYAAVSRPALATPWSVEVRHRGGFNGPITIATTNDYFDLFDENGFDPDPTRVTATPESIVWEFEPPPGDTLMVSLDARLEPRIQWGRSATTSVLMDGKPVVAVSYRTRVMP